MLQGVKVAGRGYGGGWLDWLTPFSLLTGVSVVAGYALLGACWLIWKTEGGTQEHAFRLARLRARDGAGGDRGQRGDAVPRKRYFDRWLTFPSILFAAPVPLLVGALSIGFWWALLNKKELLPFLLTLGAVSALLRRAGDQHVSRHRPRSGDDPPGRGAARTARSSC